MLVDIKFNEKILKWAMFRKSFIRLLLIGFSDLDAANLSADLSKAKINVNYKLVSDMDHMRMAFYEREWQVLICNHGKHDCSVMEVLEIWKQTGRDLPFIIYSNEIDDENLLSTIRNGVHDFVRKGDIARLALVIERELKNLETKRAKLQADSTIYRLTYYDELTGFPRRNLFNEKVTKLLSEQQGEDKLAAIYFIKMNRLPFINSTYGYSTGDLLIQQLSYRLSVYMNSKCLLSRIESCKFAFFNSEVNDLEDIQEFADKIMRVVSVPIMIGNIEFYVTLNMGVSVYPIHGDNIAMLLANVENTLYAASHDNLQSSCRYYLNQVGEVQERNLVTREALHQGIDNNELVLLYQSIVDLQSGEIKGVQAILRWNHPQIGLLMPDKFLPLAYENGLILEIWNWMLRHACQQTKYWHEAGYDALLLAIPISAGLDLTHSIRNIKNALAEIDFPSHLLELVLPESQLQNTGINLHDFKELGNLGVRFSVGNYGVGGASIQYLKQLPVYSLKLDPVLTAYPCTDTDNIAVVSAINALAKSLGFSVMAEAVETQEQFKFLYETQCDYALGDYFGKPVNATDFFALLEQRKTGTLA